MLFLIMISCLHMYTSLSPPLSLPAWKGAFLYWYNMNRMIPSLPDLFSLRCYSKAATPGSWRISPQHWAGSTGAFQQSQKQFPLHGRVALSSPQSPERLTLILASAPATAVLSRSLLRSPAWGPSAAPSLTPHLPVPVSPLPSLLFSPQLSLPSTKFLSFHRPPCSVPFH